MFNKLVKKIIFLLPIILVSFVTISTVYAKDCVIVIVGPDVLPEVVHNTVVALNAGGWDVTLLSASSGKPATAANVLKTLDDLPSTCERLQVIFLVHGLQAGTFVLDDSAPVPMSFANSKLRGIVARGVPTAIISRACYGGAAFAGLETTGACVFTTAGSDTVGMFGDFYDFAMYYLASLSGQGALEFLGLPQGADRVFKKDPNGDGKTSLWELLIEATETSGWQPTLAKISGVLDFEYSNFGEYVARAKEVVATLPNDEDYKKFADTQHWDSALVTARPSKLKKSLDTIEASLPEIGRLQDLSTQYKKRGADLDVAFDKVIEEVIRLVPGYTKEKIEEGIKKDGVKKTLEPIIRRIPRAEKEARGRLLAECRRLEGELQALVVLYQSFSPALHTEIDFIVLFNRKLLALLLWLKGMGYGGGTLPWYLTRDVFGAKTSYEPGALPTVPGGDGPIEGVVEGTPRTFPDAIQSGPAVDTLAPKRERSVLCEDRITWGPPCPEDEPGEPRDPGDQPKWKKHSGGGSGGGGAGAGTGGGIEGPVSLGTDYRRIEGARFETSRILFISDLEIDAKYNPCKPVLGTASPSDSEQKGCDISGDNLPDSAVELGIVMLSDGTIISAYDCNADGRADCALELSTDSYGNSYSQFHSLIVGVTGVSLGSVIAVDITGDGIFDYVSSLETITPSDASRSLSPDAATPSPVAPTIERTIQRSK